MRIESLVDRIQRLENPRKELQGTGRALVRFMANQDRAKLHALVSGLAPVQSEDGWCQGFLDAIQVMGSAMDLFLQREEERIRQAQLATRESWRQLMPYLSEWLKPKQLADHLSVDKAHVSRVLKDMRDQDIVECIEGKTDKRTRLYRLTRQGKSVAQAVGISFKKLPELPTEPQKSFEHREKVREALKKNLLKALEGDEKITKVEAKRLAPMVTQVVDELNSDAELIALLFAAQHTRGASEIFRKIIANNIESSRHLYEVSSALSSERSEPDLSKSQSVQSRIQKIRDPQTRSHAQQSCP